MVEHTDASKSSAERHVKNRSNTNLLTQRQTGGKCIMGNQGTKDWKLTAFFAISLMLIAGLFGNAAIAADGDGTIDVTWGINSLNENDPVLPAGYEGNMVQFTYTGPNTSMVGGALQITIPNGWSIPEIADGAATEAARGLHQFVTVTVNGTQIYQTEDTSLTATTDAEEVTHGSFSLSDTKIGFTFGTNWSSGGILVILLGSVTTPIPSHLQEDLDTDDPYPYTAYTFETKSKSRGGTFVRLLPSAGNVDTQPLVRVGNIQGTRIVYDDVDTERELTKRVVTVTPATSYPGETHNYEVIFTAPGPMYNSSLTVTFPSGVLEFPEGRTASNQISVSASRDVSYTVGDITDDRVLTGTLTVNLTRINNGQKVTITLKDATVINVGTQVSATTTMAGSSSAPDVTRLTGGVFALVAGSGTLSVSPGSVKANATLSKITVTYTAATKLTNVDLW